MKINNGKELQNKAITHSTHIDYKDFMKIYSERTNETYYFLTIETTLLASDPLRFRKNLFHYDKNDSNWSNDNFRQKKIKQNEAQYG